MTDHNFTPPPDLVEQWVAEIWHEGTPVRVALSDEHIATRAAQWGADQELEACCEYIAIEGKWFADSHFRLKELRAARRPKPPSLKEQALNDLNVLTTAAIAAGVGIDSARIRQALEQLND